VTERFSVCRVEELREGERRIVDARGVEVGVFNLGERLVAYRNRCPHMKAPVCRGRVGGTNLPSPPGTYRFGKRGRVLHCPWHGWQFDLETGEGLVGYPQRLSPVECGVEDGEVVLYLPPGD